MDEQCFEYKYVRILNKLSIDNTNIKEINSLLKEGWVPIRECNFGNGTYQNDAAILILLQRKLKIADVVVTEIVDK
jgi:hypothetical protein